MEDINERRVIVMKEKSDGKMDGKKGGKPKDGKRGSSGRRHDK